MNLKFLTSDCENGFQDEALGYDVSGWCIEAYFHYVCSFEYFVFNSGTRLEK